MKDPIHSIAKALYDHDTGGWYAHNVPEKTNEPEKYVWGIEAKRFMVMMKAYEESKK